MCNKPVAALSFAAAAASATIKQDSPNNTCSNDIVQLLLAETTTVVVQCIGGNGQSLKHPHKVHCKNRVFN